MVPYLAYLLVEQTDILILGPRDVIEEPMTPRQYQPGQNCTKSLPVCSRASGI